MVDGEDQITRLRDIGLVLVDSLFHFEVVAPRVEFDQAIEAKAAKMAFG